MRSHKNIKQIRIACEIAVLVVTVTKSRVLLDSAYIESICKEQCLIAEAFSTISHRLVLGFFSTLPACTSVFPPFPFYLVLSTCTQSPCILSAAPALTLRPVTTVGFRDGPRVRGDHP